MRRSKVAVLRERQDAAAKTFNDLTNQLEGMEATPPLVERCYTCGAPFTNMLDYEDHYVLDDERHLNIGNCPQRYNNGRLMPSRFSFGGDDHMYTEAHEVNKRWWEAMLEDAYMTNEEYNNL